MKCPQCQRDNPEGAKFCNECGCYLIPATKASPQFQSFDEKLKMLQRYLPQGLTEKVLTQRDRIEGERKQVTVMFCDMQGFTPLVERVGPEEAYLIMDQVYEILIRQVNDYEGTVNEMTGDGIMALFGAPIALEEAPQRALWSALSIHREIARFNDQRKGMRPVEMRIGIHSGPVVVGTMGNDLRVEFKAVGNTVNLASRMESLAEPGTTCVTDTVFRLTRDAFNFERLGKKVVKGKSGAIPIYKVLSAKQDGYRPRLGSERMIFSRMVGRSCELEMLEQQVRKVINGTGSIVNIIGEAGIGKTRLLAELSRSEVIKEVRLLEGKAVSMGRNLSFHPIIDILKQWAEITPNDADAAAIEKLQEAIGSLMPEKAEEVLPSVATLMGIKMPEDYQDRIKGIEGEALEKLILKNMRDLLIQASELGPLMIVMEDLHWADASSIDLLTSLFRLAKNRQILFVNLLRPGDKRTGDRLVESTKETLPEQYVEIVLKPLDELMSETLIGNMLNISGVHHAFISEITQRAGGNPYFIEEVVRSLMDAGAIVLKDGKFEVTEKIRAIAIPNTINDVLMARIDRLEAQARDLVKVASIIGRTFFYRILSEVANSIQDIDDKLSYLKKIELFQERMRMEELEYLFKHALAQEAAYDSILPHKRKELHLKVANSIEKVFSEKLHEFYGMLAYHCSRGENLDKTEKYLMKAGEEALRSSASSEALHYYQEALVLYLKKNPETADPQKVALLEKNISLAFYNKGQYEEAIDYFDKALGYYWGKSPKHRISAIFKLFSGFAHLLVGLYLPLFKFRRIPSRKDIEAIDLFFKKLKALAIINPKKFFLDSFQFYKKLTRFDLTKFELGIGMFVGSSTFFSFTGISFRLSSKILALLKDRVDRKDVKSFVIYDFSETLHHFLQGNWQAIREPDDELVEQNLRIGEIYWASQHLFWHAWSKVSQGYFNIPELAVTRLNEFFKVYENDLSILLKYLLNTNLLMECRRLPEALAEIEKGVDFAQKRNLGQSLIQFHSCQASIHILKGDIEDAEKSLEQAKTIKSKFNVVPWQACGLCMSQFEYDLYRFEESLRKGDKAVPVNYRENAEKSGKMLLKMSRKVAKYRPGAYKLMGVYYWLSADQKNALKWWQKAIEEGERLGARLDLSRIYLEVGKHLLEAGSKYDSLNGIEANDYLEKARVLFKEMDFKLDLKELDKLLDPSNK